MADQHPSESLNQRDQEFEQTLRPRVFDDFVGQGKVRERLELAVEAARGRGDVLDHVLLSGPPGLGKTTLAYILANTLEVNIRTTSGPITSPITSLSRG